MKLNVRSLALASGTLAAVLFALCALFVALAPQATMWATEQLFHLAVAAPPAMTWGGFVAGVVFWFALTAASAGALAALYNRWTP